MAKHKPAMSTAAQLDQLLEVLPKITGPSRVSLSGLAEQLGTTTDALIKVIAAATERDDDIGGFNEPFSIYIEAGEVSARSDQFKRPMRLRPSELRALDLGLAMLLGERPPEEHAAIARARARLRKAAVAIESAAAAAAPEYAEGPPVHDAVALATIKRGLADNRKLRLRYRKGDSEEVSERIVCPTEISVSRGKWYLFAHCETSDSLKTFRLDRIESVALTDDYFAPDESFSAVESMSEGRAFLGGDDVGTLRVRYSPTIARWIEEREEGTLEADGSLIVDHPLADVDWAVRHVLQYGAEAEVLEPEAVRQAIRERLSAMA